MTTNSEARQIAIRAVTSTTALHNEDWIALFNTRSITAGTFNERLLITFFLFCGGSRTKSAVKF